MRNLMSILMTGLLVVTLSGVSTAQEKAAHPKAGVKAFAAAKEAYDQGDQQEGLRFLKQAAEAGHAEAQYVMGMKYLNGGQIPKDDKLSFEWTQKAAKQGHVEAAMQMSSKYMRGTGVEKDEKKAHQYLRQSVTGGNTNSSAQFLLAQNYLYGWGTGKDPLSAANWLRQAAAQGHERATQLLATVQQDDVVRQSVFQNCDVCPTMMTLPRGAFLMGAYEPGKAQVNSNTKLKCQPRHFVNLPHTFALAQTEVTNAQWNACVKDKGCTRYLDNTPEMADHPVVYVHWDEAQGYAAWLAKKTNQPYRLPTESEWEYAARSGLNTAYPTGPTLPQGQAHCQGCDSQWDNKSTAPVKSFPANGYGLYGMLGNAEEWMEDCLNTDYEGKPPMGVAWATGFCKERIHRGGSYSTPPEALRVYDRDFSVATQRSLNRGFRVALTLEDIPKRQEAAKKSLAEGAKQEPRSIKQPKPSCRETKEMDGWNIKWTHESYTLMPALYEIQGGEYLRKEHTNVKLFHTSTGEYKMWFQFTGSMYRLGDIYQLYVDGVQVYEGRWTNEKSADGKSSRDKIPPLSPDVIQKMEKGAVAEVRAVKKRFDRPDQIEASVKFSLAKFAEYRKFADQRRQIMSMSRELGRCR